MSGDKLFKKALKAQQSGKLVEAQQLYRKILKKQPHHLDALYLLGTACAESGDFPTARTYLEAAADINARSQYIQNNLGNVYLKLGKYEAAQVSFEAALNIDMTLTDALVNLGVLKLRQQLFAEARNLLLKALGQNSNHWQAMINLGNAHKALGELRAAQSCYERVLAVQSDNADVLMNLGNLYQIRGEIVEAIELYRRAAELGNAWAGPRSNYLMALNYHPDLSAQQVSQQHLSWGESIEYPQSVAARTHVRDKKVLRVGYVSADFCRHPVGMLVEPLIEHHDPQQFELYCYSDTEFQDDLTLRLKAAATQWRDTTGMADQALIKTIVKDQIDILVDLAGHTRGNRLKVFAAHPAPCQIAYLGYPCTTGLKTMDFMITDAVLDPVQKAQACYTEELLYLDRSLFIYRPPQDAPAITALPALGSGRFTFASFNNFSKISQQALSLWAQVLTAVPEACLLLQSRGLSDPDMANHIRDSFAAYGVSGDRIELLGYLPFTEHLTVMQRVDMALDSFPWNGHMTTLNCLWMGVPVLSLTGERRAQRMGQAILQSLAMEAFVCDAELDFVTRAKELAYDPEQLSTIRGGLRERMRSSSLMDEIGYTRSVEQLYLSAYSTGFL